MAGPLLNAAEILNLAFDNTTKTLSVNGGGGGGSSLAAFSTPVTMQNAAVATGNGTVIDTAGYATLLLTVSGITSATITVEGLTPAATWVTLRVRDASNNNVTSTITANGTYIVDVAGFDDARARISTYGSGTITATGVTTSAPNKSGVQPVSLNESIDEDIDAITVYNKGYTYTQVNADTQLSTTPICLGGYIVASSTSGVISLYDNTAASGNAFVLSKAVSAGDIVMLPVPITLTTGLYFDLVSGTATVWVLTRKVTAQ